jgi:hypothetical protein
VIPLDWESEEVWGVSNKDWILRRLAPNYDPHDTTSIPDFRVAPYFEDHPDGLTNGRLELESQYVNTPPLLPNGSTPIGNSMRDFSNFYDTWKAVATSEDGDPFFQCRSVNLLIITDGDETCFDGAPTDYADDDGGDANPCRMARDLLDNNGIRTFVVGFGLQAKPGNFLDCIAREGGTDAVDTDGNGTIDVTGPILPGNEDELVEALKSVIESIRVEERSFAAAAVPQGQATTQDKAYLTSFRPLSSDAIWPGRLDSYLRPIPLTPRTLELPDGSQVTRLVPDPADQCGPGDESACHLWNAGEEILEQAATLTQIVSGDYNLGPSRNERRVYYGIDQDDEIPYDRRYFERPTSDSQWLDMLAAMNICDFTDTACGLDTSNRDEAIETLDFFHVVKRAKDPGDGSESDYLLGDIFHSDPVVMGNPDTFRYWAGDVGGSGLLPTRRDEICTDSPNGYRCFFLRQQYRRKMLLTGSNDGQMHAFDAGIFRGSCEQNPDTQVEFVVGEFDNGTGREIFSYVPRVAMPQLVDLKEGPDHQWSVDGRIAFGDVFIDPVHDGAPGRPEWRSVVMSGLREGGAGYYALDMTQPDDLGTCYDEPVIPVPQSGGYVPSCSNGSCPGGEFPAVLFEFTDTEDCGVDALGDPLRLANGQCDSDENGLADLGNAWSRPLISRIQLDTGRSDADGDPVYFDRYVAIFGGGSDPIRKGREEAEGNHIYMVDMETGKAIYKRRVPDVAGAPSGSVPMDLAAVDLDQDGYIDTIYFGTTGGFMYKVDMSLPQPLEDVDGAGSKVTSLEWEPFPIFDADSRPIYFEPGVVFVAQLRHYALVFGSGDREDLWSLDGREGRVYSVLDENFRRADYLSGILPHNETRYAEKFIEGTGDTAGGLLDLGGWFIRLASDERVITRAFSLGGITVISSFQPLEESTGEEGNGVCRRFGDSRVTVVKTTNADHLFESDERYFMVPSGFLSTPYMEVGQTRNPGAGDEGPTADEVPDNLRDVIGEIKELFPSNCRFANYTVNIKAVRDDTGIEALASVPVCTFEANWRDF